jgi:hypothetical protein
VVVWRKFPLGEREREALLAFSLGASRLEVAERFGLSDRTVGYMVEALKDAAEVKTIAGVVGVGLRKGWIK